MLWRSTGLSTVFPHMLCFGAFTAPSTEYHKGCYIAYTLMRLQCKEFCSTEGARLNRKQHSQTCACTTSVIRTWEGKIGSQKKDSWPNQQACTDSRVSGSTSLKRLDCRNAAEGRIHAES